MELTKAERKELIQRIQQASGIAQYALEKKMTNEQLMQAVEHIEVLELLKSTIEYNRYGQKKRTEKANKETNEVKAELQELKEKFKEFLDLENSEILSVGRWLLNALSRSGEDRKNALLERELVHKEDYNETVQGMRGDITSIREIAQISTKEASGKISSLEKRIDTLGKQLAQIGDYIANNYGKDEWNDIKRKFDLDQEDEQEDKDAG